jgi:predicted nucleotide-binding protein
MVFKISGLDKLQKELNDASEASKALDGELTTLRYNPDDPSSVEAAIRQVEEAIDTKIAPYRGNAIVENMAEQLKEKYREEIFDAAAAARLEDQVKSVGSNKIDPAILRQIENAVTDLRSSEYTTFDRHVKKLARLLHSSELEPITSTLIQGIDLDAWIKAGEATQGGTIGSATLDWPGETEKDLGTIILLIDRFAANPDSAADFAYRFYNNGNSFTHNLQNMIRQMIVPFTRDYIEYVKSQTGSAEMTMLPARTGPADRKVFVVHGHDEGAREAVARYLERLGFEAIILHEQANKGRTVIEKIEAHGEVGFAVVLLTPDDVGSLKGDNLQPRARQNVLLELGYFVGRLGRSRVCALKRGEVEVPSDFGGVVYETFDDKGAWKTALGKELEAAGFEIDWNAAMRPSGN